MTAARSLGHHEVQAKCRCSRTGTSRG